MKDNYKVFGLNDQKNGIVMYVEKRGAFTLGRKIENFILDMLNFMCLLDIQIDMHL